MSFLNCLDGGCGFAIQGSCDSDRGSKFFCEGRRDYNSLNWPKEANIFTARNEVVAR